MLDDILSFELPTKLTFAGQATLHTAHFYPRAISRPEIGVLDYPDGDDMIQFGIAYTPEFRTPAVKEVSTGRTPS